MNTYIKHILNHLRLTYHNQIEFLQATEEIIKSLSPLIESDKMYRNYKILEQITFPDRIITFKVTWLDERNHVQINTGYRVQFNSAIGPYKGGLRFHPSVNLSILKFLAFEQIFKNSLTGLPLGGGKGGSDFNPKGKSDYIIMRFCQSFMNELYRHIGPNTDIPAGDIGVGAREIGYLYGRYKVISNTNNSILTGKKPEWGGSLIRPEATGYGVVYFLEEMLNNINESMEGKTALISGSGNVAQFAIEKALELGLLVKSISDSSGTITDIDGINQEKYEFIKHLKNIKRGRIKEYADKFKSAKYYENKKPWGLIKADIALPCATQNEITLEDARILHEKGCIAVSEGANMPSTSQAVEYFFNNGILFGPAKAANAGGVAVSGFEMTQNAMHLKWTREEVDHRLKNTMKNIFNTANLTAEQYGVKGNLLSGANIAGFKKVAQAMIDLGI